MKQKTGLATGGQNQYNETVCKKGEIKMEITLQTLLIVCPLVFLAGLIDAIAGGGGLISLPAYFFAGVPAHMAIATNKLSSSIGTLVAAFRFYRRRLIQPDAALMGVGCALLGSAIGSNLSLMASENLIRIIMIPACLKRKRTEGNRGRSRPAETPGAESCCPQCLCRRDV